MLVGGLVGHLYMLREHPGTQALSRAWCDWNTPLGVLLTPSFDTVRKKSALIAKQIERRDSGKFKNVNDALTLQRLEREREQLLAELPALHIIT